MDDSRPIQLDNPWDQLKCPPPPLLIWQPPTGIVPIHVSDRVLSGCDDMNFISHMFLACCTESGLVGPIYWIGQIAAICSVKLKVDWWILGEAGAYIPEIVDGNQVTSYISTYCVIKLLPNFEQNDYVLSSAEAVTLQKEAELLVSKLNKD